MDDEAKRSCFEPFFTTKGERGTGLGLAMVYGVVQRHSADIEIESVLGKGTTIRLAFPLAASADYESVPPALSHATLFNLRILVVDDDPLLLQSLTDIL